MVDHPWIPASRLPPVQVSAPMPPIEPPRPRPPAAEARRTATIVCCPFCKSDRVNKRSWQSDRALVLWECRDCHQRWKEQPGIGDRRAAIP